MQYGKRARYKPALYDVFLSWVISTKISNLSRTLQGETLSNQNRVVQLPFLLNDKDDGAEEGPHLEDITSYCQMRTLHTSMTFNECSATWRKNNSSTWSFYRLCKSLSCIPAERVIQMEWRKATGSFKSLNTNKIVSLLPVLNLTCCIILSSDTYIGVFPF